MVRFPHIMQKNMGNEFPNHIVFFDTETSNLPEVNGEVQLVLKLGVACYNRKDENVKIWKDFYTELEFWEFVKRYARTKSRIYLVAHNVAFDFRVLNGFENLKRMGYSSHKILYKGTMVIMEFKGDNYKTIVVLDNMNYFKSSLENLGNSIGVPKLTMPKNDDVALLKYCKNDVLIMITAWELFYDFLRKNDLGNFAKTIAGQAMNAFRHRFMKHDIYIHTNKKVIDMERESYHGGRTEAFFIGKAKVGKYYLVDVNSMYPSVMKDYDYPTKLDRIDNNISAEIVTILLKKYCLTAKVLVNTKEPVYAVMEKDKLIFPIGIFETVLTTREIEYGIKNNLIVNFINVCSYEKANLFSEYVDFFYAKKREYKEQGNEAFSYLSKLFLNTLYGKFGQRNENFVKIGDTNKPDNILTIFDIEKGKNVTTRIMAGSIERSEGLIEGFDSFVAIAAHITADARMKLWNYFLIANRDNVYYCDTDSMILNETGFKNVKSILGKELGKLDLKSTAFNVIIRGLKDYRFGKDNVVKGISKNAKQISQIEYEQTRFEGLSGALRKNRTGKMFISTIHKTLKRNYTKGTVTKQGGVEPFVLAYQPDLGIINKDLK